MCHTRVHIYMYVFAGLCVYTINLITAKNLGFNRSPVAYLALKSRNYLIPSALTRGVSYASAGAGILDSTVSMHG